MPYSVNRGPQPCQGAEYTRLCGCGVNYAIRKNILNQGGVGLRPARLVTHPETPLARESAGISTPRTDADEIRAAGRKFLDQVTVAVPRIADDRGQAVIVSQTVGLLRSGVPFFAVMRLCRARCRGDDAQCQSRRNAFRKNPLHTSSFSTSAPPRTQARTQTRT
jgi:hypothetical protein